MMPAGNLGRIPPHSEDVEKAVLGAVLLSSEALEKALEILRPEDFYKTSHKLIFESIQHLSNSQQAADLISLTDMLRQRDHLDKAGGPSYIAALTSDVPTTANVDYYAKIIRNNSFRRKLITISSELTSRAYDESEDTQELIAEAEKKIFEILDNSSMSNQYQDAGTIVTETVNVIEKLYHAGGDYTGVPSGFPELDQFTSGFQNSEYIVIGARPSVGKTALALTMASYMAVQKKIPIGFFTLEMSGKSLMQRLLSAEAKIDSSRIRNGMLKHSDFSKLTEAAGRLYESPLYIEDTPNIKLLELRAQARRMKKNEKIRALFVDYIGLIEAESRNNIPRHEQVAEISRSLKSLARELDIPVIALSQVGRQSEGKEPTLADLRESGSIEQDADVVMFIHKQRETDKELDHNAKTTIETDLILAKQRNGPVGTCKLVFIPRFTRFESLAKGTKP
jgi:replicative DNA helicase